MSNSILHPVALSNEEQAKHGFTNFIQLTDADVDSMSTAATALVVTLLNLLAGETVEKAAFELITPFKDSADAANNTTTIELKNGATSMIGATEVNANGTTVTRARTDTPVTAASAQALTLTFGAPATGKTLAALDTGKVRVYFRLNRPAALN